VSKGSPVVTRVRIPFNFGKTEPVGARSPLYDSGYRS